MCTKLITYAIATILSAAITLPVISTAASTQPPQSKISYWNDLAEFNATLNLRNALIEKDYMDQSVTLEELDHIFVLLQQLTAIHFPTVDPCLALAVISVESGFRSDCKSPAGAIGLMQVVPRWHSGSLSDCIGEPLTIRETAQLLEEPYYNILAGLNFMSEILDSTEGDLVYALMWYNGGYQYARKNYVLRNYTSVYAEEVIERAEYISSMLNEGGAINADRSKLQHSPK